MLPSLTDILACPACGPDSTLALAVAGGAANGDEVVTGTLACQRCGATYPIIDGIPRFVPVADHYAANFGFQWRHWTDTQIDRLGGHRLSETRFFADSRWPREWLAGKTILDAGCGAGRFADVAAAHGARVIALDLSQAVEACRTVTAVHGDRVRCVQASLLAPPLRAGVLDGIYCMGVLQHTPDPYAAIRALPRLLKPGGRLALNFYEEGLWRRLQVIKYTLRLITPHLPTAATLALARGLTAAFFPLTRFLSRIPKVRILNHFIPIAAVHHPDLDRARQYAWTLLDTFDWYGPRHEIRLHHDRVHEALRESGLVDTRSGPGLAWGTRPAAGDPV